MEEQLRYKKSNLQLGSKDNTSDSNSILKNESLQKEILQILDLVYRQKARLEVLLFIILKKT